MNWNDLRTLIAIADSGSLAGAAQRLKQNHSTVFRRLNALETDLGVTLFERLPEGYLLTAAGERALAYARDAAIAVDGIERDIAGHDFSPTGLVRVTAPPDIARARLGRVFTDLREHFPGLVIEILCADNNFDLNRREADIAIRGTVSPPPHLIGRKLADIEWHLYRSSRSRGAPPADWRDAAKLPLIGADESLQRVDAFRWLEANYSEAVVVRSNDISTMAALARDGAGCAVLPSALREPGVQRLLPVPVSSSQLWLLTHPDRRNITRNRVVWEALIEAFVTNGAD